MRKAGGGNYPPSLDVLVQGRFLRKKYKDPMTESGEWDVITAARGMTGEGGSPQQQQPGRGRNGAPSTGLGAPLPAGRWLSTRLNPVALHPAAAWRPAASWAFAARARKPRSACTRAEARTTTSGRSCSAASATVLGRCPARARPASEAERGKSRVRTTQAWPQRRTQSSRVSGPGGFQRGVGGRRGGGG